MERDYQNYKRRTLINGLLGFALLGGFYSIIVDYDHIWVWIFHESPPFNLSGSPGRPFHTITIFLLYSMVLAPGISSLMSRWIHKVVSLHLIMSISSSKSEIRQLVLVCSRCGSKLEIYPLPNVKEGFWRGKTLCNPCFEELYPHP